MSANLSRLRLFQRHLRSLVWVGVWVWDWIHSHTPPRTRSPSSRPPPFTHYPFPPRSLVCGGQPSPHKPRLVVSHSTCPPLSSSPHAHSFVLGTAVINNNNPHARRVFASSFSTGPTGDRGALHCRWNVIATQPIGLVPFQARGILPVAERGVAPIGVRSSGNLCVKEEYV